MTYVSTQRKDAQNDQANCDKLAVLHRAMTSVVHAAVVVSLILVPSHAWGRDPARDGRYGDALTTAIAQGVMDKKFDLNHDGRLDVGDIKMWLSHAGAMRGSATGGRELLEGDADLDERVDGLDYLIWSKNKLKRTSRWTHGDFNADGIVDDADLQVWQKNKFLASETALVL